MKGLENLNVSSKIISINSKVINFKFNIEGVAISSDKVFIVTDVPANKGLYHAMDYEHKIHVMRNKPKILDKIYDELNNVYCYDYEGNLLWQIKPPKFSAFPDLTPACISSIWYDYDKEKFFAYDYMGRTFDVNLETGELMSFTATK
jgi:hypothetical protein